VGRSGERDGCRIGFLGAGLIATYHSKSLRRSGAAEGFGVVRAGVYDPDRERAEAFARASGHTVCATEDAVLDGCDAVYVCTWTSEHPRQVAKAIERGVHVFCEKPLATSLGAAEEMAAAAAAAGITHQVGLVLRRSPAYLWARHLATDARAGRTMSVVFRDDQFIPVQGHYGSTWRGDRDLAGAGTLLEHSIHDIDMMRFLVGDIERVSAHQANFHALDGIEDAVTASIAFTTGAIGTLATVWHDNLARPSLRRVELFCERRYIVIDGDDWFGPVSWTDSDGSTQTLSGDALAAAAAPLLDGPPDPDGAFVRAVVDGTPAWPDLHTAVHAHRVVEAMYRSAREHGMPHVVEPGDGA
jgi:UDP-N-acetyl-2-amino-2-deoxyglucuronate dehydrogenase